MKRRIVAVSCALLGLLTFAACSDDSVSPAGEETVGEVEQAVAETVACMPSYPGPLCDAGMVCCGYQYGYPGNPGHTGTCAVLSHNPYNCGSCGHACAVGQSCDNGVCVTDCNYHDECPSDKICVWTGFHANGNGEGFAGNDLILYGSCETVTCTVDTDCDSNGLHNPAYEPDGDSDTSHYIAGNPPNQANENLLKCCSGKCVATSSDPKHCGSCSNNLCNKGTDTCFAKCNDGACSQWLAFECTGAGCTIPNVHYSRVEVCP